MLAPKNYVRNKQLEKSVSKINKANHQCIEFMEYLKQCGKLTTEEEERADQVQLHLTNLSDHFVKQLQK